MTGKFLYLFDGCVLDAARRELRRGGEIVAVEPQVFDILLFLVENRERVVTKDDLYASVWGGRIVSESALASRLNAVRSAIGDNGEDQRLIRTFARKGFRFVGDVREEHPSNNPMALEREASPVASQPAALGQALGRGGRLGGIVGARPLSLILLGVAAVGIGAWLSQGLLRRTLSPAPAALEAFNLETIPLVTSDQRKMLVDYASRPNEKALAITIGAYGVAYGAADPAVAKYEALESCRLRNTQYPCRLYATGMTVVFDRALLSLPSQADLRSKPVGLRYDAASIPVEPRQGDIFDRYAKARNSKALAVAGGLRARAMNVGHGTQAEAIRRVVEQCSYLNQVPCLIVAVDDEFTVQIPRTRTITGIFLPRTDAELSENDRKHIVPTYDGNEWRALARGAGGWHAVSNAPSEEGAITAVMSACRQSDSECRLFAIGNFLVDDERKS